MKIKISQPYSIYELGSRQNQEDCLYPLHNEATIENAFFILCDGMGGHERGEVASNLVCKELSNYIKDHWDKTGFTDVLMYDALNYVLDKLEDLNDDSLRKPGTTLTFLAFHKGGVFSAHIGDSRIYHIRPCEKRILYKSRDHSQVYDMLASGEIRLKDMGTYQKKNVLTRALIPGEERRPKPSIAHIGDVRQDDYFFMCSDGILEQMSDEELVNILSSEKSDEDKKETIIEATKDNKDNHSAYIIRVDSVESEIDDENLKNDEQETPSNAILLEEKAAKNIVTNRQKNSGIVKLLNYLVFLLILGIIIFLVFSFI